MYESETNEIERRWKQGSQTFYPKAIEILLARIHWLEEAAQQSVQADGAMLCVECGKPINEHYRGDWHLPVPPRR